MKSIIHVILNHFDPQMAILISNSPGLVTIPCSWNRILEYIEYIDSVCYFGWLDNFILKMSYKMDSVNFIT